MTGQQLKNSILQMAVQGKLVPQDPNDEPAAVLLERIRKEKEQLIKEGKIKKEKNPSYIFRGADNLPYEKVGDNEPVCIADEVPFEIPDSWEWVRLSGVNDIYTGNSINESEKKLKYTDLTSGYYYIGTKDVNFDHTIDYDNGVRIPYDIEKFRVAPKNSILMCIEGGSAGRKISFTNQDVCFGNKLCCFVSRGIEYLFLYYYLQSPLFQAVFKENTTGIIGGVSVNTLKSLFFPIPPLQEQKRIVEKLIQLESVLNTYTEIEETIEQLNTSFPELLKKSILQEAVQGKLVPQEPTDEPASVLLERIRAEKEQLIKTGKIKRDKHESVIFRRDNSHYEKLDGIERCIDDEIPFEIPETWEWTRFGQVVSLLSGTDFKPEEYNDAQKGTPYITGASSLSDDGVLLNRWTETPRVIANRGDILLVCKGSGYGKTVICDIEEAHIARQIMAIKKFTTLDMRYIRLFLQANFDKIKSKGQGVIPGIDRSSIMSLLIPIPPLSEQHRIVEKKRELFDKITLI